MKKYMILGSFFVFALISLFSNEQNQWQQWKKQALDNPPHLEGWCSREKSERMMELIHQVQPELCVEIGVFGGASIYPTASALKFNNKGIVHAIDPWKNEDCLVGYDADNPNYKWWKQVDLQVIYRGFVHMLNKTKLRSYCVVHQNTSAEAANQFKNESIDILHIDGNHTEESAYFDATTYLPKVKKGGYIWFDDVNWATTKKAISYLLEYCELDPSSTLKDPYILLRKK